MEQSPALPQNVQQCIEDCQSCHAECLETATHMCLEMGGRHTEPTHFRLMLNCAQICATAADFMLSRSAFHEQVCGVCAEVCTACAQSCEAIGGMEHCVELCRQCAASCREMSRGSAKASPGAKASRASASQRPGNA
jgi:hypothetical protein